jgi:hypothetical protein
MSIITILDIPCNAELKVRWLLKYVKHHLLGASRQLYHDSGRNFFVAETNAFSPPNWKLYWAFETGLNDNVSDELKKAVANYDLDKEVVVILSTNGDHYLFIACYNN